MEYSRPSFTFNIQRNFVVCVLYRRQARNSNCTEFLLKLHIQNLETIHTLLNSCPTFILSSRNRPFCLRRLICNFLFPFDIPPLPYQSSFPTVSSCSLHFSLFLILSLIFPLPFLCSLFSQSVKTLFSNKYIWDYLIMYFYTLVFYVNPSVSLLHFFLIFSLLQSLVYINFVFCSIFL